ncbi:MAG: SDR family NAD(P)-dependent oxidoreductase [Nocardioides sp.]|uniref:SDR family NAD(P)-dependent oxidoreductase n=1 Tax=Nocardioides sp. TaxID=35761 RepID=UPI00238593C8|nr:SDR family NAD(P)-dependent oxidoreductase [Nocardioides sp.]MDE0775620.1 SDR family NAD(P)-dependent oxidoreductase [Nocardioides sp.]
MDIDGARFLVVGGSGVLGGLISRSLVDAGARVVVTGRDPYRLAEVAAAAGTEPITLDVVDVEACAAAVGTAIERLGGLDGLVVATGVPAFGPALETEAAVAEELFAVNALGPMALLRAAAPALKESSGGVAVVLSAILADLPTNQMADYSASKAALSAWLGVVRRENRRRFRVVDVRPPHLDTGLAEHPLAGAAPKLPEPLAGSAVVDAVLEALRGEASEIVWDPKAIELVLR